MIVLRQILGQSKDMSYDKFYDSFVKPNPELYSFSTQKDEQKKLFDFSPAVGRSMYKMKLAAIFA